MVLGQVLHLYCKSGVSIQNPAKRFCSAWIRNFFESYAVPFSLFLLFIRFTWVICHLHWKLSFIELCVKIIRQISNRNLSNYYGKSHNINGLPQYHTYSAPAWALYCSSTSQIFPYGKDISRPGDTVLWPQAAEQWQQFINIRLFLSKAVEKYSAKLLNAAHSTSELIPSNVSDIGTIYSGIDFRSVACA